MAQAHSWITFATATAAATDARALAAAGGAPTSVDKFGAPDGPHKVDAGDDDDDYGIDAGAPRGAPPADPRSAAAYHERRPEPNYSEFAPEFVDQLGRQYSVARAGAFLETNLDDVDNAAYAAPSPRVRGEYRRLLLFLRMPINQRWQVDIPSPEGEKLALYHVPTQVLCHGVTDGVFVTARARTGHLFVRNFETGEQVSDPARYESWLRISARDPGAHWF